MYLQGSGTEAVPISEAAQVTLSVDNDMAPDPAFGDSWETNLRGLMRFSGSFGGNFDTAQAGNALWEAAIATSSRKWYMYPDQATATNYYYGLVWPKLSVEGSVSSKGSFTAAFVGDGQLDKKA